MFTIRKGKREDVPQVFELLRELTEYENGLDQLKNTAENLAQDGFGENPLYGLLVAEKDNRIVGYSLYYFRYSTWKGKRLYLEDLLVTEPERGSGVGKELFEKTLEIAKSTNCTGMMWQVLNWNEPAINFYKKAGAELDDEWINCHLDF
ncbi:MAG: GNAT family N-acetyltransferase [Cyclobacteriaceae bacterium]